MYENLTDKTDDELYSMDMRALIIILTIFLSILVVIVQSSPVNRNKDATGNQNYKYEKSNVSLFGSGVHGSL